MPSLLEVELVLGGVAAEAALEVSLAGSLLAAIARGERRPVIRAYRPPPTVAFGRRDAFLPGFAQAARAARGLGFAPVVRAQGGRAAAYDQGCVVLDEIMPAEDSAQGIQGRFAGEAERQARELRRLGVDARVGEVPGEYCPGAYTVNARGKKKLIGSAQRIVRGGWLFSSVVVVDSTERVAGDLKDGYDALGLAWDPGTVGSVADEEMGATVDDVKRVLLEAYAERYRLVRAELTEADLAAARRQIHRYRVDESG